MSVSLLLNDRRTAVAPGVTLFDAAASIGIRVPTSCVTNGKCKECVVEVASGAECLSAPTEAERHLTGPFRLSCQAFVSSSTGEIRCHTMRRGRMRIERHAMNLPAGSRNIAPESAVTRDGDRVLIDGKEVARTAGPLHGLAVDLGTTTVVLRLVDLESGEVLADSSFENPQRFGGSDVMSRIHYDTTHPGKLLRRTLAGYLTHAIEELPVDPKTIYEVVVVGNSTMRDLFFRQNVYSIGQHPYRSITEIELTEGKRSSTVLTETGRRCLLPIHPAARVYGAPIISGHVGADAAAAMLAVGLDSEDRLVAIMDIGTNTELVIGNRHRIVAASCPAGPAFEGGAISSGMPGLDGAIEDIAIAGDGTIQAGVIGGGSPAGICGSGLVALLSELCRTGRMNELGRFESGDSAIAVDAERGIHFTESDVNELAQAKGANVAGLQVVFDHYGIAFDDIDVFYLAGGFGRHLDLDASRRIGLIPDLPDAKIVQIGNAAIEGATMALVSVSRRRALEETARHIEHCRLETHPRFFDYFVDGCQFRPLHASDRVAG
jgi:uncharacterized 2Fe-2S/4Fe-4S cluster protein (DUF4445 family)